MSPPRTLPPKRTHRLRRIVVRVLLLLLLLAGILYGTGLPAPAANALLRAFPPAGLPVECDGILHRPGRGFIVHNLRVYSRHDLVTPWLRAPELRLRPHFGTRLRRGHWSGNLHLADAKIRSDLGVWADDLVTRQPLTIDQLNLNLRLDARRVTVHAGSARFAGLRLNLEGPVPLEGWPRSEAAPSARGGRSGSIRRFSAAAAPIVALIERFEFSTPPDLWFRLRETAEPNNPLRIELTLRHKGPANLRGAELQSIELDASADALRADLKTLVLEDANGQRLAVSGNANLAASTAEVRLQNTLPRYAVEALSPVAITRIFARLAIRVEGSANFDLHFGPSSFETFGNRLEGHIALSDAFYRDAFFPEIALDLKYAGRILEITSLRGQAGHGSARGPVAGELSYDLNTGKLVIRAEGAFKPDAVISLVGPVAEKQVREWEFQGEPPRIALRLSQENDNAPVLLDLNLSATKILSRGALFDSAELRVTLRPDQIRIEDLLIFRGTQMLKGSILADPAFERLDLDISSSLHLPDVAPILGPAVVEFLQPFRLRGSNQIDIRGRLDLRPNGEHRLSGTANFNDLIWEWAKIDNISSSFRLDGGTLQLPNIRATLSGGGMTASFRAEDLFSGPGSFQLETDIQNADLFRIITAATDTTDTPYTGSLTLLLKLAGALRGDDIAPASTTYRGEGSIRIREGTLFRIPLLLGLSRILSKVVSGFGYASQTDFSADFRLADGEIRSDNLFLHGRILSVGGEGRYRYDGKINANLRIQLLNEGLISDALRLILWPIRKLIEVQLTGTLDEPDWQPRNLPKELFGK
jgi:hypothetical protein